MGRLTGSEIYATVRNMTTATLLKTMQTFTPTYIGKRPVVVLPLDTWEEIQDRLEDIEMLSAKKLPLSIKKSRQQIKVGNVVRLEDL